MGKYFTILLLLILQVVVHGQEHQVNQLRILAQESRHNFQNIKRELLQDSGGHMNYTSGIILEGSRNNEIIVAKDQKTWCNYLAIISDSCSTKKAKKLAEYWRDAIRTAMPNYKENRLSGRKKTVLGSPRYGYDFEYEEGEYDYWISINYIKRLIGDHYFVTLQVGRQLIPGR